LRIAELSEENFEKMTQRHELMQELRDAREAGDEDAVDSLMGELKELMPEGREMIRGRMGFGKDARKGMGRGHGDCPFAD
jgi:hypothetical protein